tara:strand:- start:17149 stop:17979 length:831 start_codon:yes stop_codon:yes gene_type:complete
MKNWIHEIGSSGQEVRRLQSALGNIVVDGSFGPKTEQALQEYQSKNSLQVDGRSGPATRSTLEIDIYPGIDVSKWNTVSDWSTLKNSGLAEFCWIKATEGGDYMCQVFEKHAKAAASAGIPYGAYHFARPDLNDDPHREVRNFVKNCPIEKGRLRPVLDFEKAGDHSPDSIRAWVLEFLQEFEAQSGVRPIIYTGGNMTKYHLNGDTTGIDDYILWHAYYSKKALKKGIKKDRLGGWKEWTVWQWTGSGEVPGHEGEIDRNWLVGGPSALRKIKIE